ncbi:uncharacterized protein LOC111871990, partial [Cryptotermes secundus]|uniref:uncharacterized protein LOC111871990 n=1 Tax=Cryptotermes secundus TaxID=105785 RepID=UPI000CD7D724
ITTKDSRVRFQEPDNTTSASLKSGSSMALRQGQFPRGRPILQYPIPDYKDVKPKTNTYNTPKTCGKNVQISEVQYHRPEQNARTNKDNYKEPSQIPVMVKSKVSEEQNRTQEKQATKNREWNGAKPSKIPVLIRSKVPEGQDHTQEKQATIKREWKGAKPSKIPVLIRSKKSERLTEDGNSAPVDSVQGQRSYIEEHNDREINKRITG